MQCNDMADDYDLEGVTTRLEAMEARRRTRQGQKSENPVKQQVSENVCEFELAPADLSSGGSGADSDDGYQSTSTSSLPSGNDIDTSSWSDSQARRRQIGRGRARSARVTDSLDLSMSAVALDGPSLQAEAIHSNCSNQRATHSELSGEETVQKVLQHNGNNSASSSAQPEHSAFCKPSRIPKLIQQRRQLQAGKQPGVTLVYAHGRSQATSSALSYNIAANKGQNQNSPPFRDCLSVPEPFSLEMPLRSAGPPTLDLSRPNKLAPAAKVKSSNSLRRLPEEIDSTAAEEQRLLQSLEKLDRRLTNVSTSGVVRECGQQTSHQAQHLKRDAAWARANIENSSSVCTTNAEIDEETLRSAAYGGGTHCKLRQPSSVSVRSSSVKRAELSCGVHKARVRVGGALVNETGHKSSTDGNGKHKVFVKKKLAHLLF